MELMRSWGLEDAVRAGAVDVEWRGWQSDTLATVGRGLEGRSASRRARRPPCSARPRPACVPQDHLEPVLLEHLRSLPARACTSTPRWWASGPARGRRGRAARPSRAAPCAPSAPATSSPPTARAAGSASRSASPCAAPTGSATSSRRSSGRRCGRSSASTATASTASAIPHGAGTFLPAGRGDRWVYGTWVEPEDDPRATRAERFARRIRAGAGIDGLDVSIERTGAFSFAAQLADRFRAGNVFLAGDAAHRVTPRGGTGMNTAIRGGHDLGWKLGWVLRGWAGPELLDTYEAERRPVAAHNVARSADPDGSDARRRRRAARRPRRAHPARLGPTPAARACPRSTSSAPG